MASNTIGNRPTVNTAAPTTQKAAATTNQPVDVANYLKTDPMVQSIRNSFAGATGEPGQEAADAELLKTSAAGGWVKSFDDGVQKRIADLGHPPTADEMKDIVNKESFAQRIFKFAV